MKPFRIRKVGPHLPTFPQILDVGCGFHSPGITKRYLPDCWYVGIEKPGYTGINTGPNTDEDIRQIDHHILMDLGDVGEFSKQRFSVMFFDAVIASNTLEHLSRGTARFYLRQLPRLLRSGGVFFVEVPSHRVFKCWLPSNYDGVEHRAFLDLADLINPLLPTCEILEAGTRRDWRNILRSPATLPIKLAMGMKYPTEYTDLLGLSYYVLARKR